MPLGWGELSNQEAAAEQPGQGLRAKSCGTGCLLALHGTTPLFNRVESFGADTGVIWPGGRRQWGVFIYLKGILCPELCCLPLSRVFISRRRLRTSGLPRDPTSSPRVSLEEALDVLSIQLKKEKKTPKRVLFLLYDFQGTAPWRPHFPAGRRMTRASALGPSRDLVWPQRCCLVAGGFSPGVPRSCVAG